MEAYTLKTWDGDEVFAEERDATFLFEGEALTCARELAETHEEVEVWRGDTFLARFTPEMSRIVHLM